MKIPPSLRFFRPRPVVKVGQIQKLTGRDLDSYLWNTSSEEARQVKEQWKKYAARKELIDFQASSTSRSYRLDPGTLDYVQTINGARRIIPADIIKMDVNRYAKGVAQELRRLSTRLSTQQIAGQEWYDESSRVMKLSYLSVIGVAKGSSEPLDNQERDKWLALAILIFLLLNKTAEALEDEELDIESDAGKLRNIMGLRGNAVSGLFENWRLQDVARKAGYTEAMRVLGVAEHCEKSNDRPGCVELAGKWVPIWHMVPIGGATCRDNCKCRIKFRGKTINPFGG